MGSLRERRGRGFPVGVTDSGVGPAISAFLYVSPDGRVDVTNVGASAQDHLLPGEIQFRTDP